MDYRILGPFEVANRGRSLALGGAQQRALLALLVIHRNQVLTTDRLIDELWGEQTPATAVKTLQGYISNLRKVLPADAIVTQGRGYVLTVEPDRVDVARFEQLVAEGRRALDAGDPAVARELLSAALGLFRGDPLSDFGYQSFAQSEIARVEELRLAAIEDRLEADLTLGEHAVLVGELETLVREHPTRERLTGQLMLALYRSGRQADALEQYRRTRHELVRELGIEPGPELQALERAILNHDPALGSTRRLPRPHESRWVGLALALAGALLVIAAGAAAIELLGGAGSAKLASAPANSVALISPKTGELQAIFPVGGSPTRVAVGAGAVWALNADDQTVTRIDLQSHAERTFGTGGVPAEIAAGDGSLWVGNGTRAPGSVGPVVTAVSRFSADADAPLATVTLPSHGPLLGAVANGIAVSPRRVWVVNPDLTISRIDPSRNKIVQHISDVTALGIATGTEGTWVFGPDRTVAQLSPSSDRVHAIQLPASDLSSIAVGDGSVWVTDPYQGLLWRIDPGSRPLEQTIQVGVGASDATYSAGAVWVANGLSGTVLRVDPRTNRVVQTISVGNTPGPLAAAGGAVWVAVAGSPSSSVRAASSGGGIKALPASVCGPVLVGTGRPQLLIASDLPLRGQPTLETAEEVAAIVYVLREHDFRAGHFRLGYQSCDDSTTLSGVFDDRKCIANAKSWVKNALLVGVIGPFNSGCAVDELPIANQGGPLAILSPTNSYIGLTHDDPNAPPGFTAKLYPSGVRNYAHEYPGDDVQAAALAEFARERRLSRIYVLSANNDSYASGMTGLFQLAAGRLGLHVAGSSTWDPRVRAYSKLANRVAATRADGIYVSGVYANGGAVIQALRQRLGPAVAILSDESALPVSTLFQTAGTAARGVYIATGAVPNGPLGPAGRQFVTRFYATQRQSPVDRYAIYAAQATEVMLNAIARSSGTRPSVTRALLTTCVHNGILRSFCFGADGDPTNASITILQAQRPSANNLVGATDGAGLVTVIAPPRTLTR
jgi:DNA-binding SARP family transcriptional activator/ABC-type branched-subunit amino acid transport system substrate-binding protein